MLIAKSLSTALGGCIAAASANANACAAPQSNWSLVQHVPDHSRGRPTNVIDIDSKGALRWNGAAVTEAQAQAYLGVITKLSSANITVLNAHPNAPCATLARVRQRMDDILGCDDDSCAEVID